MSCVKVHPSSLCCLCGFLTHYLISFFVPVTIITSAGGWCSVLLRCVARGRRTIKFTCNEPLSRSKDSLLTPVIDVCIAVLWSLWPGFAIQGRRYITATNNKALTSCFLCSNYIRLTNNLVPQVRLQYKLTASAVIHASATIISVKFK